MNILFICTGNTCRSPMAEGIFKTFTEKDEKLKKIIVSSAGLMAINGDTVSENSVEVCKQHGIDISSHKSKQITEEIIDNTDLFVCMTMNHAQALVNGNIPKNKIYVLNISDPYGGNIETYNDCYNQIYEQLVILAELIKRNYSNEL